MVKVKGYELREKSKSDLLKQLEELKLEVPPVARCCPPPAQAAVATLARGRAGVISWWKLARQPSPGPPLRRAAGCTGLPWLAGWLAACAVWHSRVRRLAQRSRAPSRLLISRRASGRLAVLPQQLSQLRVAKVTGGAASKLSKM